MSPVVPPTPSPCVCPGPGIYDAQPARIFTTADNTAAAAECGLSCYIGLHVPSPPSESLPPARPRAVFPPSSPPSPPDLPYSPRLRSFAPSGCLAKSCYRWTQAGAIVRNSPDTTETYPSLDQWGLLQPDFVGSCAFITAGGNWESVLCSPIDVIDFLPTLCMYHVGMRPTTLDSKPSDAAWRLMVYTPPAVRGPVYRIPGKCRGRSPGTTMGKQHPEAPRAWSPLFVAPPLLPPPRRLRECLLTWRLPR